MSRRIDIELTSTRDDGTWTWRAAGAKQPKGVLTGTLLPSGAAVGDVLRAEIEGSLDRTDVVGVVAKERKRTEPEKIEIIAKVLKDDELVTQTLARRGGGDRGGRGDRRDRGDRGDRGPRKEGDRRPGREGGREGARDGGRPAGGRGPRDRAERSDRPERGDRPERPRRERAAPPARPKAKRLRPGRAHRKAALDALAPEEQVIAEQLLRGGVPAIRLAVEKQNEQAKAEGGPSVKLDALLVVAERLHPALRVAEWRDRAEAAVADLDELDLRDLRSVVVAAETGAKDDESRALADQLRAGLAQRVDAEQTAWLTELAETLADNRVVRALRLSSRPPKAGAPLPAELSAKLTEAASASLTADTVSDRWATVLDALSFSPVRLTVTPASRPEKPSDELLALIGRVASRLPKIAEAFGITPPPEQARRKGSRPPAGRKPGTKRPPKPALPPKPAVDKAEAAPESPAATPTTTPQAASAEAPETPQTTAVAAPEPSSTEAPETLAVATPEPASAEAPETPQTTAVAAPEPGSTETASADAPAAPGAGEATD